MKVLSIPDSRHTYLVRLRDALRERGIEVAETPFPYLRWPGNFARFLAELSRGHDLFQMHWLVFDSLLVTRLFFSLRTPRVWTVHNLVPHRPIFRDDLAAAHLYLDHADVAIWHSRRSLEEARKRFEAHGLPGTWSAEDRVVPHMSFNGGWPDDLPDSSARRELGVAPTDFVVGHFAPTQAYKGTEDFLEVVRRVPADGCTFLLFGECGDPRLAATVREEARSRRNLKIRLERIPDEEMQTWFKACDVVVQPYREVTTAGSIYFPIAFRRPVIAAPRGNIPDVIEHGVTGWLARDVDEIVACILEARADPEATRAVGARAHAAVDAIANLRVVADGYLAAYRAALGS